MAKNKKFRRKYTIEVQGITTNHFMEKFLDSAIGKFMMALVDRFAQLEIITMTAEEVDANNRLHLELRCSKCKAFKYTEDGSCLFCAAEEDDANDKLRG